LPVILRCAALRDYEIVVIMREHTPFPAEVLDRLPEATALRADGRSAWTWWRGAGT
jgi:hypothetical protein